MAVTRIGVKPELLNWACERAGNQEAKLRDRFPQLASWIEGKEQPTLSQLERFANSARVPVGKLLLSSPPDERLPIPDLRTVGGLGVRRPSANLLDIIQLCQRRQDWYRDYAAIVGEEPKAFVGSATLATPAEDVAEWMRRILEFDVDDRGGARTLGEAMRSFVHKVEAVGVMVMVGGVVGTHTGRKLDPDEFRGFALADNVAPLVFVNGADAEAAQMFTLAHELAHLWLGSSALSNADMPRASINRTEQWCNRIAAEFLVPLAALRREDTNNPLDHLRTYSARFKVSSLVILRRLLDAGLIERGQFDVAYAVARQSFRKPKREGKGGGNFHNAFPRAASRRLIRALYADTLEGNTTYRDALDLLGIGKAETFRELGKRAGAN